MSENTKKPAERRTKEQKEQIIAVARTMIQNGQSPADTKRAICQLTGYSPKTSRRIVDLARARLKKSLDMEAEEHFTASSCFWSDKIQEVEPFIQDARRAYKVASDNVRSIQQQLMSPSLTDEERKGLKAAESAARVARKSAIDDIAYLRNQQGHYRTRLDSVLGVARPIKVAQTTADGRDVNTPATSAMTLKAMEERKSAILSQVRERAAEGSPN